MGTRKALGRAVAALVLSALMAAMLISLRSSASALVPGDPLCVAKPATVVAGATKIMVAGDSITSASAGDYTWRYFLWKQLVNPSGIANPAPAAYDFVGPYTTMVQPVSPYARTSDDYNCDFDKDTASIPGVSLGVKNAEGKATGYLTPTKKNDLFQTPSTAIRDLVDDTAPGVLIMFAAAQDLAKTGTQAATADEVLDRAQQVVAQARLAESSIKVVLVTAPDDGTVAKVADYNAKLVAQAPGWTSGASKVVVAQAAKNWGTPALTYDTIHPNPQGEVGIAADISDALVQVGIGTAVPRPLPNYSAYTGPHSAATLAQPTVNGTNVSLSWTQPPGSTVSLVQRKDYTAGSGWVTAPSPIAVAPGAAGPPYVSTFTDTTYEPGHVYQYRILSAKSTTVWATLAPGNTTFLAPPYVQYSPTITSNVVTVPAGATLPPTGTPTSTSTGTPTPTSTGTPTPTNTGTPTPTGTGTPTPTSTGTPTPTSTGTPTPTPTSTTTVTPGPPGAVPSFSATPSVHGMSLAWGTVSGATGYRFTWRLVGSTNIFSKDVGGAVKAYNITGLSPGKTYGFRVQALKGFEEGPLFVQLNRVPKPYALAAPAKPTLTALSGHRIRATWPAVAKASRYEVWLRAVGGAWRKVGDSSARTYTSGALVTGRAYEIRVRGCDGAAPGPYSTIARIRAK